MGTREAVSQKKVISWGRRLILVYDPSSSEFAILRKCYGMANQRVITVWRIQMRGKICTRKIEYIKISRGRATMKKIIVLVAMAVLAFSAAAWAQEPAGCNSLLLVKKGQLMKLVYKKSATKQAAEMVSRFKIFEWREPRDGECFPMRSDIKVFVQLKEVTFSYATVRRGQYVQITAAYATDKPFWRQADTVMYHADKYRPASLLHPPALESY